MAWGCGSGHPPDDLGQTALNYSRIVGGLAFVGLTDAWASSVCAFVSLWSPPLLRERYNLTELLEQADPSSSFRTGVRGSRPTYAPRRARASPPPSPGANGSHLGRGEAPNIPAGMPG